LRRIKHGHLNIIFDLEMVLGYTFYMLEYKFFDHTADIGVEISGRTKKELFANAAYTLFDILIESNENENKITKGKQEQKIITVNGEDTADLLINFLRELLYLFNGEYWVADKCEIMEYGNKKLAAQLMGEPYHKRKHFIKTEIKAVTYSGLSVIKKKSGWKARVIFDV
jgi:SHS2 domain-containing protein